MVIIVSCDVSCNDRNIEDINDAWGYYGYWVVLVCTLFRKAEREYMNDIVRVLYTITGDEDKIISWQKF
jgi:hypothetical protein